MLSEFETSQKSKIVARFVVDGALVQEKANSHPASLIIKKKSWMILFIRVDGSVRSLS